MSASVLSRIIADEIRQKGPISMARFMELSLYCPVYGYYQRKADSVGRAGDFQTSVSVGPVFGELLAARFAGWLDRLRQLGAERVQLVESGSHDGQLAADILGWLSRERADLLDGFQYHLLEPSLVRREWQKAKLKDYASLVSFSADMADLLRSKLGVCGILFSNEMLDALPVDRFGWDRERQAWFVWLVRVEDGRFAWHKGGAPDARCRAALDRMAPGEVRRVLPDGYVIDYSITAECWWRDAANLLRQGWLMAVDYGFESASAVLPERVGGTLRGYRRHQATDDVLSSPGEQDITAHVHFDELRRIGEECGLRTEFSGSQEHFLVQGVAESCRSGRNPLDFGEERLRQFKTLVHPEHFGRSFRVLVQSRQ